MVAGFSVGTRTRVELPQPGDSHSVPALARPNGSGRRRKSLLGKAFAGSGELGCQGDSRAGRTCASHSLHIESGLPQACTAPITTAWSGIDTTDLLMSLCPHLAQTVTIGCGHSPCCCLRRGSSPAWPPAAAASGPRRCRCRCRPGRESAGTLRSTARATATARTRGRGTSRRRWAAATGRSIRATRSGCERAPMRVPFTAS